MPMPMVLVRNWWALALRGLASIVLALAAFLVPGMTVAVLVLLFGAYALADGVLAIVAAVRAAEHDARWGWMLVEGILGVAAGLITFAWPGITALVLLYVIAFWAIVTGVSAIMAAIRLRREIAGEWLLGLNGVISVAFGLLLILVPVAGALTVVWLIGAYAAIGGVALLALAFRLRGLAPR
jgi:uncharacterized membrane protein HdeD (DUF308 family)